MIAQPPYGLNAHIRADGCKFFAQETDVDLHMVFYSIRVKAPDFGQNSLLGHILSLQLQKIPHDIKFPRGQLQLPRTADQRPGSQIERCVAERERVDLRALPPEELKAECLLPNMVGDLLKKGRLSVSVLHSADRWFGMTYHEDRQAVAQELARLHENGTYPATLRN